MIVLPLSFFLPGSVPLLGHRPDPLQEDDDDDERPIGEPDDDDDVGDDEDEDEDDEGIELI